MEMRSIAVLVVLAVFLPLPLPGQRLTPPRKYHAVSDSAAAGDDQPDLDEDEDDLDTNSTGMYVGAPCDKVCSKRLNHVYCNSETALCDCEKKYPVRLNPYSGCGQPKKLGDQCYYKESCEFTDPQSSCIQIQHNAICQCKAGFHQVARSKPTKKMFCAEDLAEMTTDFSTLAGVVSGIAVLSGLICFVLRLFNQNLYTGRHRYGNANLAPPILFSSEADTTDPVYGSFTGSVPTILNHQQHRRHTGTLSRASSQRTITSLRRPSSAPGCRPTTSSSHGGIAVSASRAGAARAAAILLLSCHVASTSLDHESAEPPPSSSSSTSAAAPNRPPLLWFKHHHNHEQLSLAESGYRCHQQQQPLALLRDGSRRPSITSVHSNNSVRSYSMRRYEKEREQKEEREMQRRLAKLASSRERVAPTPSPHSTDDLLPTLLEDHQMPVEIPLAISEESASTSFQEEIPSTSKRFP